MDKKIIFWREDKCFFFKEKNYLNEIKRENKEVVGAYLERRLLDEFWMKI